MTGTALMVEKVAVHFGGLVALSDMNFAVGEGEIVSLIGPNGAGKTTAFNVVTGFLQPTRGAVSYRGTALNGLKPHQIAGLGLARTFQRTSVFPNDSVYNNLMIGLHRQGRVNLLEGILGLPRARSSERRLRERAGELVEWVGLERRAHDLAGSLSYGEQRLVGVALALAAEPSMLLLDEPVSGMNASETHGFVQLVRNIRDRGVTILLVEHDMPMVMGVSDRIVVLNFGRMIAEGTPDVIRHDPVSSRPISGRGRRVLEIRDMVCGYGGVTALRGISLEVKAGQIVALIGANGAGKSTTLRAISGLVAPRSGSMPSRARISQVPSRRSVVASGIAHCPEGRQVFPHMTVEENLDMGAYLRTDASEVAADRERIYAEFPRLAERRKQAAGTLSGGEQQMLAIGRALMSRPRLIMLDEPSLGLAPNIVERTFAIIRGIRDAGTTVLLVEQNAFAALEMCDHAYLLEGGRIVLSGPGADMIENEHVRKAYLGG